MFFFFFFCKDNQKYWFHKCQMANSSGDFNILNCSMIYFHLHKLYTVFDALILMPVLLPNSMINADKGYWYAFTQILFLGSYLCISKN